MPHAIATTPTVVASRLKTIKTRRISVPMCRRLPQLGTHLYSASMSRAFVNEDKAVEDLPDRPVSTHPNYVTVKGSALIDSALENARREHAEAQAHGDRA